MARFPHLCKPILRFYWLILIVAAGMSVVGGYYTTHLRLESDMAALLPESFVSVQELRRMEAEVVGGSSTLRVALKSQDFDAMLELADTLAERLLESEYVGSVDYQNDVEFYEANALLFLEESKLDSLHTAIQDAIDREKQALNPFMVDDLFGPPPEEAAEDEELARWEEEYEGDLPSRYYLNPDSTVMVLSLNPAQSAVSLSYSRRMVDDVRGRIEALDVTRFAPDMEIFYGSNIKNRVDEEAAIMSDVIGTAQYGITGVFLLIAIVFIVANAAGGITGLGSFMVIAFRGVLAAVLVSVSLFMSLSWTFGLTYLLVQELNMITAFLIVILFGMGVDYGIHAMARYVESKQAGLDTEGAIHRMVCKTGSALATTAFTTSAAFFSLMLLQFKGFSELGLITGMGMIFAFVAMVVVLPSLVVVAEKLHILDVPEVPGRELTAQAVRRPFEHARGIIIASVVVTVLATVMFTQVSFQYDFTNLRIVTQERELYSRETTGVFSRSESPAIVLTDSREEVAEVVAAVEEMIRTDTLTPTIGSVRSILSVLPANQQVKLDRIREIRNLVEEEAVGVLSGEDERRINRLREFLAVDETFEWEDFPEKDRMRFTNARGEPGNFVLIYPNVALRDGRNAMMFRDDVGTFTTDSGKEFHAASSNIIVADMLTMIETEGPIAVLLSLVVVFFIIAANFRSFRAATFVITPLIVALVWMGGGMWALGWELNFFNVVVFPSVVGIGVDDGVHIYHRYREEGPGSLPFVMQRTGAAVLMTTITTIVGYSGLLMAHHPGLQSLGKVAALGLTMAFITSVFLLPALLERLDNRGGEKAEVAAS